MKHDIEFEKDITTLVSSFYSKLVKDEALGYIFTEHMSMSLEAHLPIICSFWSSVLLDTMSYRGQVMVKHIELSRLVNLDAAAFDRWIALWVETVDAYHTGPIADAAKEKAKTFGQLMQYKIKKSQDPNSLF